MGVRQRYAAGSYGATTRGASGDQRGTPGSVLDGQPSAQSRIHPDSINTNTIQNSCTDEESFRVFWTGPDDDDRSNKLAAEWDAHIKTWGGAGEVTHSFLYEGGGTEYVGMYGTVDLHGDARLTLKVRGRFDGWGWGEWSPPVGLFCFTE